jgi:predicted acetyltransferase
MLRLVDVKGSLELRGYPRAIQAELHFDVVDDLVPENHGRWVLEVKDGQGRVRTGGKGHLRLDVRSLASLYTGYLFAEDLARLGRLEGPATAIEEATATFLGSVPWMSDLF